MRHGAPGSLPVVVANLVATSEPVSEVYQKEKEPSRYGGRLPYFALGSRRKGRGAWEPLPALGAQSRRGAGALRAGIALPRSRLPDLPSTPP